MREKPTPRAHPVRDQQVSGFTSILAGLVARIPGAMAAVLVDGGGEAVDYAGRGEPDDVRLAGAHWQLVLEEARAQPSLEGTHTFAVLAARRTFVAYALPEGYAMVLILTSGAGFGRWRRAIGASARLLAAEAGWAWTGAPAWHAVSVFCDERDRPAALEVGGRARTVVVLGTVAGGLASRERGWRVRFESGVEATLVREPGGFWYADEPVVTLTASTPPGRPDAPASPDRHGRQKRR